MGLMRKLTSAIVATSIVFSLVGTALADLTPAAGKVAGQRMYDLGLLKGKTVADPLSLNDKITRAEFVTVMVRAFGKDADAQLLAGAPAYPDTATHWASGYVALSKNMVKAYGMEMGLPDGNFHPDDSVTPAQVVAFLMKFLGIKEDTSKAWPASFLTVAVEKGLITAEMAAAIEPVKGDAATRGQAFAILDPSFYSYNLGNGETFYTKYAKIAAPTVTIDEYKSSTIDTAIEISGKVENAISLTVGTTDVTPSATGTFTAKIELPELKAYEIPVMVKNLAGVKKTEMVMVTRTVGDAASIEATLSAQLVKAGEVVDLAVVVKDANGNELKDIAYEVAVDGAIGTYADGKFTAATAPATGTITVSYMEATPAVLDVAVVAGDLATITVTGATTAKVGQAVTFTAKGYDVGGNEVALENVMWSATKGGVINPATGEFAGTTSGSVTVTAKAGTTEASATVAIFGDPTALALDIPTGLIANQDNKQTVNVKVVDSTGAIVGTSAADVTLTATSGNIKLVDANGNAASQLSAKAVNGVATFTVKQTTGWTASTTTLSAISGTLTGAVGTITSVAPTVGSVKITTSATGVVDASGVVTVGAKVVDTTGAQIPAPAAFTVVVSNGDTTLSTLSSSSLYFSSGSTTPAGSATLTLKGKEGTITLTGTTPAGYTVEAASLTTKVAGPAYQLVVTTAPADTNADDADATVKVAIQDATGTTKINAAGGTYTMAAKDVDGNVIDSATGVLANGILTFTFASLTEAGVMTFTFTANNGLVIPAAVTANVTPGAVHHLGNLKLNGSTGTVTMVADGTSVGTLSVQVLDQRGNLVTGAANAVTFKKDATDNDGIAATTGIDATAGATVNAINGVATVSISSTIAEGMDVFTAGTKKADGTYYTNFGTLTVTASTQIVGQPANIAFVTPSPALTPKAGADFSVTFKIVDATSGGARTVATDNGRAVTLEILNSKDEVVNTLSGSTANGLAKFTVNLTTAGNYKFRAATTINSSSKSVTTGSVAAVRAADPSYVQLTSDLSAVENGSLMDDLIGYTVKDVYGNAVSTVGGIIGEVRVDTIGWNVNGAADTTRIPAGTAPARDFTVVGLTNETTYTISDGDGVVNVELYDTAGTPVKIYDADLPVVATSVSTYNAGPAYLLKLVEDATTLSAHDTATIKVGVYDAAGHLKTTVNTGTVTLATLTGYTSQPQATVLAPVNVVNGVAEFTTAALDKAGTYKFEATSSAGLVKNDAIAFVVNAGDAHHVSVADVNLEANGSSVGLVEFKVVDSYDNTVSSYTGTMTIEKVSGSGATLLTSSAPIVNGKAIAQVQAAAVPGTLTIKGTVDGTTTLNVAFDTADVMVGSLAPSAANSVITAAAADGDPVYVVLKDANGNPVLNWQTHIQFYTDATVAGTVVAATWVHLGNGVYTAPLQATANTVKVFAADNTTVLVIDDAR